MNSIIKYYKEHPVTFIPMNDEMNQCMVNGIELAKILNINLFEWLEKNKDRVNLTNEKKSKSIIIEGTDEVYLHPFIVFGLLMQNNDLYIWFFDAYDAVRYQLIELAHAN